MFGFFATFSVSAQNVARVLKKTKNLVLCLSLLSALFAFLFSQEGLPVFLLWVLVLGTCAQPILIGTPCTTIADRCIVVIKAALHYKGRPALKSDKCHLSTVNKSSQSWKHVRQPQ